MVSRIQNVQDPQAGTASGLLIKDIDDAECDATAVK
jgi:hypothetical protein